MRHAFPLLAALSLALVACDASTTSVAASDPDPFYQGEPERPRIRLTVLAGTKAAPAAVARVRVEVRWPESWSQSADFGVGFFGGATIIDGASEKMSDASGGGYFLRANGKDSVSSTIEFECEGDSMGIAVRPSTFTGGGIPDGFVDSWSGEKAVAMKTDLAEAQLFCKD